MVKVHNLSANDDNYFFYKLRGGKNIKIKNKNNSLDVAN